MKTLATLCTAAVMTLFIAGTITAQDKAEHDDLRDLDGFWTPIPDGPEHRSVRDDLRLRDFNNSESGRTCTL